LALRMTKSASIKGTGTSYGWGIDDPHDIKKLDPRLNLVTELRTPDLAAYSRLPWVFRALARVMDMVPTLRRMNRVLLYRF
jgi:hypothetical protein